MPPASANAESPAIPAAILAIDLGNARIGLARSTALGTAEPLFTMRRTSPRADAKSIARTARKHNCALILVGHPVHLSGDASPQSLKAQQFAAALAAVTPIPVQLFDERLTTVAAHEQLDAAGHARDRKTRDRIIDQVAAVILLETFLQHQRLNPPRS
jgi:putative Holliday junction resolvase